VLIVEDNHINMKLLEQFIRRLKVRWQTAVNGREAVNKWRQGGFHLVLMDIQLPIMSGIEATKEIRRLERVNRIGVFSHGGSSGSSTAPNSSVAVDENGELVEEEEQEQEQEGGPRPVREEDLLEDKGKLFKSPVIIVALTASNLQSDRHEALAAGCNDFLTKVRFLFLSPFPLFA
jgi:osomolarity two-component system response regulator SSK1